MILSLIKLSPIPGKRDQILELLHFSVDRLRTIPGCLSSGVYESSDEQRTILYLEQWGSQQWLDRHVQSNLYLVILNAMDLAQEPREVSFHEILNTKSLELIVALRRFAS